MITDKKKRATVTPRNTSKYEVLNAPDPLADGSLEVHIDYYRGQFDGRSEEFRRALILKLFRNQPSEVYKNGKFTDYVGDRGYTHKMVGANGQALYWRKAEHGWDLRVELPGSYLSSYSSIQSFVRLLGAWDNMGIRTTRIDLAVTDKNKYFKWEQLQEAYENHSWCNCTNAEFILSVGSGGQPGATLNIGSRRSHKFVRIYETTVKHGFAANRIEVEFKDKTCRKVVENLIRNYRQYRHRQEWLTDQNLEAECASSKLNAYVVTIVCGSCDFINRDSVGGNGATAQATRLDWWQDFIERAGGAISIFVERAEANISRTEKWMQRQVSKSLAILKTGLGESEFARWLDNTIQKGKKKVKDTDSIALGLLYEHGAKCFRENFEFT